MPIDAINAVDIYARIVAENLNSQVVHAPARLSHFASDYLNPKQRRLVGSTLRIKVSRKNFGGRFVIETRTKLRPIVDRRRTLPS